jgi:hypothetical protein
VVERRCPHARGVCATSQDGSAATRGYTVGGSTAVIASDHELARYAAVEAGRALLAFRAEMGFDDPKRLRDGGDRLAHDLIIGLLAEQRPDDAVLS